MFSALNQKTADSLIITFTTQECVFLEHFWPLERWSFVFRIAGHQTNGLLSNQTFFEVLGFLNNESMDHWTVPTRLRL